MSAPRLLDLFCGAGGAAMGYHRAGFKVFGVDIKPQPHYPFPLLEGFDALQVLIKTDFLEQFDAIHASPPCQRWALASNGRDRSQYPDLLTPTRLRLQATGKPWVIENVPGAPMRPDVAICGCQVGLELRRVRWFETSWQLLKLLPSHVHVGPVVSVVGHGTPSWVREQLGYNPTIAQYRAAMGIDWMNRNELSQAIPPAYTEFVGRQMMGYVSRVVAAG